MKKLIFLILTLTLSLTLTAQRPYQIVADSVLIYSGSVLGAGLRINTSTFIGKTGIKTNKIFIKNNSTDTALVIYDDGVGQGAIDFKNGYVGTLTPTTLTAQRVWILPNKTGTILLSSDTAAIAELMWSKTGNAGTDSATNYIGTTDAKPLSIGTNGVVRGVVSSTGNVGIGTVTPISKFHVTGTIRGTDSLVLSGLATTTDSTDFKVIGINSSGNVKKFPYWITGGGAPALATNAVGYGIAGVLGGGNKFTFDGTELALKDASLNEFLNINTTTRIAEIGDITPGFNGTKIKIDDANDSIHLKAHVTYIDHSAAIDSAIYLKNSTSGIGGNIYKNGDLWLHNKGNDGSVFIGKNVGTTPSVNRNIGIGYNVLVNNLDGLWNVGIGDGALQSSNAVGNAVAIGYLAMANSSGDSTNTNGIAIGTNALQNYRSGYSGIGIGKLNNQNFVSGTGLVGVGASQNWVSGDFNTMFGSDVAVARGATGSYNTIGGGYSNYYRKSGDKNTAWGNHTLNSDSVGTGNTAIGSYAANSVQGSYNGYFGYFAGTYQLSNNLKMIFNSVDRGSLANENLYSPLVIQQTFGGTGQSTTLNSDLTVTQLYTRNDTALDKPVVLDANGTFVRRTYWPSGGGGSGTVTSVGSGYGTNFSTITSSGNVIVDSSVIATLGSTQVFTGTKWWTANQIFTVNGAASTPAIRLSGTVFTGGSSTTTKPLFLVEPSGATSTGWSTNGTLIGANAASGYTGNIINGQLNGVDRIKLTSVGYLTLGDGTSSSGLNVGNGEIVAATQILLTNQFVANTANSRWASGQYIGFSSSSTNGAISDVTLSRGAAGKMYLGTGTTTSDGTLIAGSIGIGTTTPDSALTVNTSGHFKTNLRVDSAVNIQSTQTTVNCSSSGTIVCSMPFRGSSYKKVIVYRNAALGAATYTFPVAFTNIPKDVTNNGEVTSLTTTSVTITGATSTGFIIIEGY